MGTRGPMPKRQIERRRRNHSGDVDTVEAIGEVRPPPASRDWHPIAVRWFRSLKESAFAVYYEPSDWAAAYLLAEVMSRGLGGKPVKGKAAPSRKVSAELFAAIWKAMGDLLTTESSRRRVRIEIERVSGAPTPPPNLADYRSKLGDVEADPEEGA